MFSYIVTSQEVTHRFNAYDNTGRNIGSAIAAEQPDGSLFLDSLQVDPAWRGQGVGADLMRWLCVKFFDRKIMLKAEPFYYAGAALAGARPAPGRERAGLTLDQLITFYAKFGFQGPAAPGEYMIRPAKPARA